MQTIYYQSDSILHRLNPLSKLLVSLPLMFLMLLVSDPWTPLVFSLISIFALLHLGRLPTSRFLRTLSPLLLIVLVFVLVYPFLIRTSLVSSTPVLFRVGPIALYEGGLYLGVVTAFRVLALLLISMVFSLTSDSADFIRALVQQWRLPYRIGYSTLAAFRFVPLMQSEISIIRAAQRVRGVNGTYGLRGLLERLRRYAVPLLANAIRQAERTALAMEARAFGAFDTRTYFRRMRFTTADWLFVIAAWGLALLTLIGLHLAGLLGPLHVFQIL